MSFPTRLESKAQAPLDPGKGLSAADENTIDHLPQTGDKDIYLKQQLKDKLIEHKQYIDKNGEDLPEIRNWKWSKPE